MKISVKIKFGSEKDKFESFGGGRYLVYMTYKKEDDSAMPFLVHILSKEIGADPKHVRYMGKKGDGNFEEHIFEI